MRLIGSIHTFLWGIPGIAMILLSGIYLTVQSGFVQIRLFPYAIRSFLECSDTKQQDGLTVRQSFLTALGSTVGTGNLIGVAGAICLGGPGSIFWMWVCAFFVMATKYAEAFLAVRFRVSDADGLHGGVMYAVLYGLGERYRFLAWMYCLLCVFASFGIGSLVQMNAIVDSLQSLTSSLGLSWSNAGTFTACLFVSFAFLLTVCNGAKGIGRAAEVLVPLSGGAYILLCVVFLSLRCDHIVESFRLIIDGAFHPGAVTGGLVGSILQTLCVGCRRGVFSNEAGLGTASMAHAVGSSNPAKQGAMGILEVFIDTNVICTLTAMVILSGCTPIPYGAENGVRVLLQSIESVFGLFGHFLLTAVIIVFSFATIIGWGLYGSSCMTFLFCKKTNVVFFGMQLAGLFFGAFSQPRSAWFLAETANAMLMIPNLCTLILLGNEVCVFTKDFYPAAGAAKGGTNANIHQCKPL